MKLHILVIPFLAFTALSGCFLSETPRIETSVLLEPGQVAFCTPDDPPCRIGTPSGDMYVIASGEEGEKDAHVRFEKLTEVGGVPIYLGEADLSDEDEKGWIYIVARPSGARDDGVPQYEIAMPACADVPEESSAQFGFGRPDAYSCMVTDKALLREFLTGSYGERFADPAWWANAD